MSSLKLCRPDKSYETGVEETQSQISTFPNYSLNPGNMRSGLISSLLLVASEAILSLLTGMCVHLQIAICH